MIWSILISKEIVSFKYVSMSLWPRTLYKRPRQFIKDKWFCLYKTMDNLISSDFFDHYYVISVTCDTYFINQSQNTIWLLFSVMVDKKPWVCTVTTSFLLYSLKLLGLRDTWCGISDSGYTSKPGWSGCTSSECFLNHTSKSTAINSLYVKKHISE